MTSPIIDFNKEHALENNHESDTNYLNNLKKFNHQNRVVFEQLLTGRSLTVRDAMLNLNINSLPRRIKDCRDLHNIPIQSRWSTQGNFKEYYLEESYLKSYRKNE